MISKLESDYEKLESRLSFLNTHIANPDRNRLAAMFKHGTAWSLDVSKRWLLYQHWVELAAAERRNALLDLVIAFAVQSAQYRSYKMQMDVIVLRDASVVGMTTSGAARLRPLLEQLKPRITIVEEAAEVLESHIVASLTKHCQHLILIGDHKQLRPKTSCYELSRVYKMDISLFERLAENGMPCVTLNEQHRMRPEIAELIVPSIYQQLTNSQKVHGRPDVKGVAKNVFFIDHEQKEKIAGNMSRKNVHECSMLIALSRYLVQQGYAAQRITVIAMYSAQVVALNAQRALHKELKDLVVSSVDGYQGEENDIVLLSLVRSNDAAQIGFLKTVNRVCVGLSRAKLGLYIIGNMSNLLRDRQSIWRLINEALVRQQAVKSRLPLNCVKHKRFVEVASARDFNFDQIKGMGCALSYCHQQEENVKRKAVVKPAVKVGPVPREIPASTDRRSSPLKPIQLVAPSPKPKHIFDPDYQPFPHSRTLPSTTAQVRPLSENYAQVYNSDKRGHVQTPTSKEATTRTQVSTPEETLKQLMSMLAIKEDKVFVGNSDRLNIQSKERSAAPTSSLTVTPTAPPRSHNAVAPPFIYQRPSAPPAPTSTGAIPKRPTTNIYPTLPPIGVPIERASLAYETLVRDTRERERRAAYESSLRLEEKQLQEREIEALKKRQEQENAAQKKKKSACVVM